MKTEPFQIISQPQAISQESFRRIQAELGAHRFSEAELAIVSRIIHSTADFDYRELIRFQPGAIESGLTALRRGCSLLVDVRMIEVGISQRLLGQLGGQIHCDIANEQVAQAAQVAGTTRSAMAIRHNAEAISGNIVVIGNAPTALLELLQLIHETNRRPALIIGVPVGFVNTVESKQALLQLELPSITVVGRKGGSSVAVAIVNALLRLALEKEQA